MTTSPSDRAKAIVEECRAYDSEGDVRFIACDRAEALIAAAITQAENEKLEEAARHIGDTDIRARLVDFKVNGERIEEPPGNTHFIPLTEGPKIVASVQSEIRSLKSKDTP